MVVIRDWSLALDLTVSSEILGGCDVPAGYVLLALRGRGHCGRGPGRGQRATVERGFAQNVRKTASFSWFQSYTNQR